MIGSFISTKIMPTCAGSGVPRTKVLLAVHHGIISTKEWLTKIVTTVFSLSSGVPLGSEGPTIAIAAGIGSTLGRKFKLPERKVKQLVHAGCSAGIAAAFNTPIAAVIFTMEEIIGSTSAKSMGPILISSLIASVTAAALIGQNSVFTPVHYSFTYASELFFYLLLGAISGLIGPLFISFIITIKRLGRKYFRHHKFSLIMFSFFLTGALSMVVPVVPGNGLAVVNELLHGKIPSYEFLALILVFKFIACAICYGAGISGGILMPVLFIGAALGGVFGSLSVYLLELKEVEIGAYCLVGMGAFFASVIRTPFTSVILVFEMTRDYKIVMPLMLASLVSYFLSERLSKGTVYEKIAIFEGYELPSHEEEDLLTNMTVESVYTPAAWISDVPLVYQAIIYPDQSLSYALLKLKKLGAKKKLKVVDRLNPNQVLGEISMQSIFDHIEKVETAEQSS